MFTGIVEELGTIANMQQSGEAMKLTIHANKILSDVHLGDSIAVNGICLTVTSFTTTSFTVDAMPETMQSTSLRMLKPQCKVNLERAWLQTDDSVDISFQDISMASERY